MVFKIPVPAGNLKKNRFEFELGAETVSLPKLEFVPAEGEEFLKEIDRKRLSEYWFVLGFIAAIDPDLGKKLTEAKLSRDQVADLYKAWGAASKVNAGESSASDGS